LAFVSIGIRILVATWGRYSIRIFAVTSTGREITFISMRASNATRGAVSLTRIVVIAAATGGRSMAVVLTTGAVSTRRWATTTAVVVVRRSAVVSIATWSGGPGSKAVTGSFVLLLQRMLVSRRQSGAGFTNIGNAVNGGRLKFLVVKLFYRGFEINGRLELDEPNMRLSQGSTTPGFDHP
jgi:hypothetical protein